MENRKVIIGNFSINCYRINSLIIGSGAASLNAALSLHRMGQKDILVATSQWGGGTSNNAGSDKQTYYKLSLSGNRADSVPEMARDLFNGKCMHGDIALCEAQGSIQAFMNLVALGVPFPHDKFGSYAGYKTDHDPAARATSAGPYTSKMMFEALSSEIKKCKIKILDNHHVITLLTDSEGLKVVGAVAINSAEKDPLKAFVLFNSTNVILGTGGPGGIYETSVYPQSQAGSTGMAFKAGATGQNLTESQFGIASVKFRWNLSGSYQQVIPRYFSTDKKGKDPRDFLNVFFPDYKRLSKAIFLKGYQWPFDPRKIGNWGSSLIDLLVYREIEEKGREVYLDFTKNVAWENNNEFSPERLDSEVYNYLNNSGAMQESPFKRLMAINPSAVDLYKEHGIDLSSQPLQVAVCAQHSNGGLKSDTWWESDLKNLFPVGEVNGSHGVYRPGGAALNSGQVGSYRAAQFISKKYTMAPVSINKFIQDNLPKIESELKLASGWMENGKGYRLDGYFKEIRKRMSGAGGIIRSGKIVSKAVKEAAEMLNDLPKVIGAENVDELRKCFLLADHCLTHLLYLEAINMYLEMGGRSRGSFIVKDDRADSYYPESFSGWQPDLCRYDKQVENEILEVSYKSGKTAFSLTPVRDIPLQDLWFERVWKDYLKDSFTES
jgi:succinate dehydrogenase/fumarate reductase flavoprotein subunit